MKAYRARLPATIQPGVILGLDGGQVAIRRTMLEPSGRFWKTRQVVSFTVGEVVHFGAGAIPTRNSVYWENVPARGRVRKSNVGV